MPWTMSSRPMPRCSATMPNGGIESQALTLMTTGIRDSPGLRWELWFPDPHSGRLLRLYKHPGSLSTSISLAAPSGDVFLGICFSTSLHHAWKCLSSMARENAMWESVSSGLLASLVLCQAKPWVWLISFFLSPYHHRLTSFPTSILKSASADKCLHINLHYQCRLSLNVGCSRNSFVLRHL